jgi:hypothetical protein
MYSLPSKATNNKLRCGYEWHTSLGKSSNIVNLTFIGPCIVVYFYSKTNEMHQVFKFISFCSSTLQVSDGLSVHHQESKTVHTASGICQTDSADCLLAGTRFYLVPASKQSVESVWLIPDALCTILDSWWWTERPSETCSVLLQNKINLKTGAYGWFYYRNSNNAVYIYMDPRTLWSKGDYRVNCTAEQAMIARRGSGGIALFFL